ncbi:MAG: cupin domain-containing protein [Thermoleophilia bacterium]
MNPPVTHLVEDLAASVPPSTGIHSRTLHSAGDAKVILFMFADGEELSEHASSRPALMQVLHGEPEVVVDGEPIACRPGTWVSMPPELPTPCVPAAPRSYS